MRDIGRSYAQASSPCLTETLRPTHHNHELLHRERTMERHQNNDHEFDMSNVST